MFAVVYFAGAPATDDEREDDDVSALEQVGAILQEATPAERKALRVAVDIALKREQRAAVPDPKRIENYEAFIESYLSE